MTPKKVTLGIDTAGGVAAAALTSDAHAVSTTDSQALEGLLPCVRRALASIDRDLTAVCAIAVCIGPGSFTGLRIGVAFAKSLAQALDVDAVGISSFDIVSSVRAAVEGAAPHIAVVQGKRGFYYARIAAPGSSPGIVAGAPDILMAAARDALGAEAGELELTRALDAVDCGPDVRAMAAARLGREALDAGASGDWRRIAIEYGQRPNAVVNWERRHGPA